MTIKESRVKAIDYLRIQLNSIKESVNTIYNFLESKEYKNNIYFKMNFCDITGFISSTWGTIVSFKIIDLFKDTFLYKHIDKFDNTFLKLRLEYGNINLENISTTELKKLFDDTLEIVNNTLIILS